MRQRNLFIIWNKVKISKKIDFDEKQIFNKLIENRLEEIYEIDVLKNNFFKNDLWKKNEFIKIVKRFKSWKALIHFLR